MTVNPHISRKIAKTIIWIIAMTIILLLIAIIGFILVRGVWVINWSFLTETPREMGQQGGILSPIIGTVSVTLLAVLIAMPFGIGTAYFLA